MTAAKNAGRFALAACTALTLVIGIATSANAATGEFTYTDIDGEDHTLVDPPSGECISFGLPVTGADNETNASATVYENTDCSGPALDTLPPKTGMSWGSVLPNAVRFNFF
ncbi:hypothetical protein [Kitasatospora sp. CB02891]|uniref:hypothetical protein n=1 Tax=Kitasatospora sp. CB02891 TaxID=2020329 RepID=UPI000C2710BA|nr:hypothetical protein [Kitasatospora sp. CB02891]PJN28176.1 hypothetical protein CG736_08415 [Kitasatospora sp. CB02891]